MEAMSNGSATPDDSYQILIVDDSKTIRLMETRTLEKAGFKVETAENGAVAIEKALATPPDLILLDINMPEMDGWEVLRQIRVHPVLGDTLVVILSSNAQQADKRYAQSLGAHSYLAKPVKAEQIIEHLGTALRQRAEKKPLEARRILIVDDSNLIRRRVTIALEKLGCELLEACDGKEACRLATQYRPDLILMDINMPEMDGLEATRRIRTEPTLQHTVVIAMTANGQRSDVAEAMAVGMNDYIVKPFQNDLLLDRVTTCFHP